MENEPTKTTTIYHVFTDRRDEWLDHYDEAKAQFLEWGDMFGCARLYREIYEGNVEDDNMIDEDCLDSTGEYPL